MTNSSWFLTYGDFYTAVTINLHISFEIKQRLIIWSFKYHSRILTALQELCTSCVLCWVLLWFGAGRFYQYPSGLIHWHCGIQKNRPIGQIPQCIRKISHNAPFLNRNVTPNMCTFLLQNGALWDAGLVHCGICEIGLYDWLRTSDTTLENTGKLITWSTWFYPHPSGSLHWYWGNRIGQLYDCHMTP